MQVKILTLTMLLSLITSNAQFTQIPDTNFEQALIDLNIDDIIDGQVLTSRIDTIQRLQIGNKNIQSLIGIEGFVNLKVLEASDNNLSELNISNILPHLEELSVAYNNLSTLDFSNHTALRSVDCEYNQITSIISTDSPSMIVLSCHHNLLTSLNISSLTRLISLYAFNNQLTNLNITNLNFLEELVIYDNNLTSIDTNTNYKLHNLLIGSNNISYLDLSNNTLLWQINCYDNSNIQYIDLSNNQNLQLISFQNTSIKTLNIKNSNNQNILDINLTNTPNLRCLIVDDHNANYISNWNISNNVNIVDDINDCYSGIINIPMNKLVNIFPNPVINYLYFENSSDIIFTIAKIYDISGKLISRKKIEENKINVSNLPNGFYILKLSNDKTSVTKKFIVKH